MPAATRPLRLRAEQRMVAGVGQEAPPAVALRDVWFAFPGRDPVLRGVDLQARGGEITVILGSSGGGKTTLLRLVKGVLTPTRGEVSTRGHPPMRGRGGRLDPAIAYIPQQLGLVRNATVLANTLTGASARTGLVRSLLARFAAAEVRRAHQTLAALGIADKAHEPVHALSGGERQRVAVARSLMQQPAVILADEFVSQLDPITSREILDLIRGIADRGVAVLMTTHEVDLALRYADHLVVLRDGVLTLDAPGSAVDLPALDRALRR